MPVQEGYRSPAGWYASAVLLALCAGGLGWVTWLIVNRQPGFTGQAFFYVLLVITAALAAGSYGCARLGRAFARNEAWADKVLGVVYVFAGLSVALSVASLAARAWGWISG